MGELSEKKQPGALCRRRHCTIVKQKMYNNKSAFFAVKGALPIYDRTREEAFSLCRRFCNAHNGRVSDACAIRSSVSVDADNSSFCMIATDGRRVGYVFKLSKQKGGSFDRCWMTDSVLRMEGETI